MPHPATILDECAAECGWNTDSKLSICLDFIEQMDREQRDFAVYVRQRADEEMEEPETTFSFQVLEAFCPNCAARFESPGSLVVNGFEAFVNDEGIVAQDDETNLILTISDPQALCKACGSAVPLDAIEEF